MKFQSTISTFVPGCVGRGSPETALPEGEVRGQVRHAALRSQLLLKEEGRKKGAVQQGDPERPVLSGNHLAIKVGKL